MSRVRTYRVRRRGTRESPGYEGMSGVRGYVRSARVCPGYEGTRVCPKYEGMSGVRGYEGMSGVRGFEGMPAYAGVLSVRMPVCFGYTCMSRTKMVCPGCEIFSCVKYVSGCLDELVDSDNSKIPNCIAPPPIYDITPV